MMIWLIWSFRLTGIISPGLTCVYRRMDENEDDDKIWYMFAYADVWYDICDVMNDMMHDIMHDMVHDMMYVWCYVWNDVCMMWWSDQLTLSSISMHTYVHSEE